MRTCEHRKRPAGGRPDRCQSVGGSPAAASGDHRFCTSSAPACPTSPSRSHPRRRSSPPNAILRITLPRFAALRSISGDRNPIHVLNAFGAALFGFPHRHRLRMFSAAAILVNPRSAFRPPSYAVGSKPVVLLTPMPASTSTGRRRLGSGVAQHRQGLPAPDRSGTRAVAIPRSPARSGRGSSGVTPAGILQATPEQADQQPAASSDVRRRRC